MAHAASFLISNSAVASNETNGGIMFASITACINSNSEKHGCEKLKLLQMHPVFQTTYSNLIRSIVFKKS
jgi:hypothetical protein